MKTPTVASKFVKCECGASLVEYAVALIIVTMVGGAGVLAIGSSSGAVATNASDVVAQAKTDAAAAVN